MTNDNDISFTLIGVTALRDPLGQPMKSVGLYVKTDEAQAVGLMPKPENETAAFADVGGLFTEKYKAYLKTVKAAQREIDKKHKMPILPPPRETPEDELDKLAATLERRSPDIIRETLPRQTETTNIK
jgi:hypothetical protein